MKATLAFLILTILSIGGYKVYSLTQTSQIEIKHMSPEEKKEWMDSCNRMKDSFDRIKKNSVARCLTSCDRVVNSKVKNKVIRESNFKECYSECEKAKIDVFEDVFFVERKVDEKYNCRFRY